MHENRIDYEGWRVAGASGVSVFLSSLIVYTFPLFLKPLSDEFSWSREAVSSAYSLMALMAALCAAPVGYFVDRLGPTRVVAPCMTLAGIGFASLAALTPHLWHLYGVFTALGMTAIGISPVALARAVSSWFVRRRGMALALVVCGGSLGGIVHAPAAQALVLRVGWRMTCLTLGGVILAVGLPTIVRFVRERPAAGIADTVNAEGATVRTGVCSRAFWILVTVLFYASIAQSGAIVHLSALLTDRGVDPSEAALALSAMGAAGLLGRLATGWLLDRFFAARVSFVLLVIAALGSLLLSGAHSFAAGALAAALIGFGMGGESDVVPYLLSRYFGLRSFSTLYGLTWIASGLAGAIGPILMGRAFDATGSYEALLVRLGLGTLGVAMLMLAMPRYQALSIPAAVTV